MLLVQDIILGVTSLNMRTLCLGRFKRIRARNWRNVVLVAVVKDGIVELLALNVVLILEMQRLLVVFSDFLNHRNRHDAVSLILNAANLRRIFELFLHWRCRRRQRVVLQRKDEIVAHARTDCHRRGDRHHILIDIERVARLKQ